VAEKNFFQLLISVSGIGPKLGKDILSNCQVGDLSQAILQGNLTRLCAIPGIGTQGCRAYGAGAERKVQKLDIAAPATGEGRLAEPAGVRDDVASALVNLGYKEAVVKNALADMRIAEDASMETVLKQALKSLMR
jgi:holliday junction DNA helicase RuvA